MHEWATVHGLRKSPVSNPCIWRLMGKKCNYGKSHYCVPGGMGLDHCSLWLKNGRPEVFISQPYQLSMQELDGLSEFCKRHGLTYSVSMRSGHLPKPMITLEITRKQDG